MLGIIGFHLVFFGLFFSVCLALFLVFGFVSWIARAIFIVRNQQQIAYDEDGEDEESLLWRYFISELAKRGKRKLTHKVDWKKGGF